MAYLRDLVAAQRAAGDVPAILSLDAGEGEQPPVEAGVRRFRLPARPSVYRYSEALIPWLRLNHRDFDAFVLHGLWQYTNYGAWRVLRRAGRPYCVFPHGMLDPWFKRAHPLKHLKKWLYWPWAEYRVLRDAARVVFTSDDERRLARESFALYRAREAVVPLGIAPPEPDAAARAAFRARFPEIGGRPFLLFLGRLHAKKGCDLLIEAFAAVHAATDAVLVMAGPAAAALRAALQARAAALGIGPRVLWPGLLQGGAKWAALAEAALFILPSHQENFGIAVVEALAVGTPVLISDRVNIWREVEADGAGLVCRDTAPALAGALRKWEALAAPARAALGAAARASFERRYRIDRSAADLRLLL